MDNIWLTPNEVRRIRYKAKKMGAIDTSFKYLPHLVVFGSVGIDFWFYPLRIRTYLRDTNFDWVLKCKHSFCNQEQADVIKKDIDTALEFMEWLKEFAEQLPDRS